MKKAYHEKKWREHSFARSEDELKKKRKHEPTKNKISRGNYSDIAHVYIEKDKNSAHIEVPCNFSIKNNIDEMLNFFEEVHYHVKNHKKIFYHMENVESITTDSILYMLSLFDRYELLLKYKYQGSAGNLPKDKKCRQIISESGFFDHVISRHFVRPNEKILTIRTDHLVQGPTASDVMQFATNKLNRPQDITARRIYSTIIETMANTKQHAYGKSHEQGKWWLMACHDEQNNHVNFTFLDNGQGIPKTIKKKFIEKLKGKIGLDNDGELINSAMNGDFRSSTGLEFRGKGLPTIKKHSDDGVIDNLMVISNRGCVNCKSNTVKKLGNNFYGTLLDWDFI